MELSSEICWVSKFLAIDVIQCFILKRFTLSKKCRHRNSVSKRAAVSHFKVHLTHLRHNPLDALLYVRSTAADTNSNFNREIRASLSHDYSVRSTV